MQVCSSVGDEMRERLRPVAQGKSAYKEEKKVSAMLGLLCSYRETKRESTKIKKSLEDKRKGLEEKKASEVKRMKSEGQTGNTERLEDLKREIFKVSNDIGIMNAAISDATYIIKWITTGREPGAIRGIERQSVYKREITFDDKWIDFLTDEGVQLHELPDLDEETKQMKEDLVKDLKEYLTPKQQDIFIMLGEGVEQAEIAKMLNVSKQAVSEVIARGRRKIKEAGWFLV